MSSRNLEKLLAELGGQTRRAEAPKHVEAALLSAFRAQSNKPVPRMWTRWALAAAAAIAIVIGTGVWKLNQPLDALPPVKLATAAPAPPPVQPASVQAAPPVVAKRLRRTTRPRAVPAQVEGSPTQEVATDFMPLEDTLTLPPLESGHILRVQMPRSTMMRFGLPVNPDRMLEPVKADVVFGQDGIARAVRFVR
jgi:hypothetical protein